jgi:protein-disulfide isomerase
MRICVVLMLAMAVALGCRVSEEPERLAAIEQTLNKIDERLGGIEKKLEDAPAKPTRQAAKPQIDPKEALAKISVADVPARGAEQAVVTIVEYSDFQCPYCRRVRPTLQQLLEQYGTQVRHVFKHFPLSFHREAMNAHKAVAAAREQGKFWEMHDLIFEQPSDLSPETMRTYAEKLELDLAKYDEAYGSDRVKKVIADDQKEGRNVGVRGTPAFFVNGKYMAGAQPYENFKREIDAALENGEEKS